MKRRVVLAHEINGNKSDDCKLLIGLRSRVARECIMIIIKQTIDNDWKTSDAISTGRRSLRPTDWSPSDGNQIKPNEVVWLQLHE